MLQSLKIKNYAIIDSTEIELNNGLNIVTGETGAGKSILLGALGLILGDRSDSKSIKSGADKLVVEGCFTNPDNQVNEFLLANDLDVSSILILRRELNANGKSRAFVNDTPVGLQVLKDVGTLLIDIVSQHQTLQLFDQRVQFQLLDAYAGTLSDFNDFQVLFNQYKLNEKQLNVLKERIDQAAQEASYLKYLIDEIEDLQLQPDEEELLEIEIAKLSNADLIQQLCAEGANIIENAEYNVIDQLNKLMSGIQHASKGLEIFEQLAQRIQSNIVDLKDISSDLTALGMEIIPNAAELEQKEVRLGKILNLLKKHRVANSLELIQQLESKKLALNEIDIFNNQFTELTQKSKDLQILCLQKAKTLNKLRTKQIPKFEQAITQLLVELAMPHAQFKVELASDEAQLHIHGIDSINFYFCANKGGQLAPINQVASGGEMSRLMLSLKALVAEKIALPSIVFDEIDTGISGEAALKVGLVMKKLATQQQIIAITHLPQIAGKADAHYLVKKDQSGERVHTTIELLTKEQRVVEIARMISGENPGEAVIKAANEIVNYK
jgi:DNA repair protein RecN (Recombination protein N)